MQDNEALVQFEDKILDNLIYDKEFASKVIPFTKKEYFNQEFYHDVIVQEVIKFYNTYGTTPTKDEIKIELSRRRGMSDDGLKRAQQRVDRISRDNSDKQWLIKNTEKYYQDRALMNAVIDGASILTGASKGSTNQILKSVQDALAVSFDSNLGHDYFSDIEKRYEDYHRVEDKISWGIGSLDDITNGGMSKKNLICAVAPSGSGKSSFMCCAASNALRQGLNVLYISMEMSETRIAERIDANLMNTPIEQVQKMDLKTYSTKLDSIRTKKKMGKLIIKEFPTSGAGANHFKALLNELKLKSGLIFDLVIVDYLNICCSSRVSAGQTSSYGYIKAISEELRGLAVEYNCAVLTATQTNRSGFNNSDIDITSTSESVGLVFVLDFMFALIRTDALDANDQIMVKQLKNRYADLNKKPFVILKVNRDRMTYYDECVNDPNAPEQGFWQPDKRVVPQVDTNIGNGVMIKQQAAPKNDFSKFQF